MFHIYNLFVYSQIRNEEYLQNAWEILMIVVYLDR